MDYEDDEDQCPAVLVGGDPRSWRIDRCEVKTVVKTAGPNFKTLTQPSLVQFHLPLTRVRQPKCIRNKFVRKGPVAVASSSSVAHTAIG